MKRLMALCMGMILALGLAACGSSGRNETTAAQTEAETTEAETTEAEPTASVAETTAGVEAAESFAESSDG